MNKSRTERSRRKPSNQAKQKLECSFRLSSSKMALSNQDRKRIERWIREHGVVVRKYLLTIVSRNDVADDLFQEVFLCAAAALKRYIEQGRTRAFLMRIAQRLAKNHFRKRKKQLDLSEQQWKLLEPSADFSSLEQLEFEEFKTELELAIERLNPMQRKAIWLRYYVEIDFQSIAKILGCPRNTAFSHCRRGVERLRKMLRK